MTDERRTALAVLIERFLKCLLDGDVDGWVDLWAEDGVFEFPFAPPGYVRRLDGKAAVAAYMSGFPDKIAIGAFDVVTFIQNAAGFEGFVEFTCRGAMVGTGKPYRQHYVALLKLDETGRIVLYRDFWNPLVAIEAFGGAEAFTRSFSGEEARA